MLFFFQLPKKENVDSLILNELSSKYTEDELKNPSEDIKKDIEDTELRIYQDLVIKKIVWFRIVGNYGEYYIAMYYDNEYNHANGEDL